MQKASSVLKVIRAEHTLELSLFGERNTLHTANYRAAGRKRFQDPFT